MKEPTKKLKNLAIRYAKLQRDYERSTRTYVRDCEPMDTDLFWEFLEYFADQIRSRKHYKGDAVKEAAHNTMIKIVDRLNHDAHLNQWLRCAQFLAAYRHWSNKLHIKCEDMPGVQKSDDSYGDWTDALPLGGYKLAFGIMEGDIANYRQVGEALKIHRPNLKDMIQNGENYVKMSLEDQVIQRFAYAVEREEHRQSKLAS
jgi:hypothetical protein